MTKSEIINHINKYYEDLREINKIKSQELFFVALDNDEKFKSLELKKRDLEVKYLLTKDPQIKIELDIVKEELSLLKYDFSIKYACSKCKDTGFIGNKICDCYKEKFITLLKESSNLPASAENIFLSELKISNCSQSSIFKKLYEKCAEWLNRLDTTKISTLFFSGDVGIGKTTLTYAIANEALNKGYSVYYSSAFNLANLFIDKQFNRLKDPGQYNDAIMSDILIIDDLGTESLTRPVIEHLFNIIDERIAKNRKLVISSNLKSISFIEKYGERIFSRLTSSTTSFAPKYIEGENLRNKKC